jgi:hypothetical protein
LISRLDLRCCKTHRAVVSIRAPLSWRLRSRWFIRRRQGCESSMPACLKGTLLCSFSCMKLRREWCCVMRKRVASCNTTMTPASGIHRDGDVNTEDYRLPSSNKTCCQSLERTNLLVSLISSAPIEEKLRAAPVWHHRFYFSCVSRTLTPRDLILLGQLLCWGSRL